MACGEPVALAAIPQHHGPWQLSGFPGWDLGLVLGEGPPAVYLCPGLYVLSIVLFALADLSAVLGDACSCPAPGSWDSVCR